MDAPQDPHHRLAVAIRDACAEVLAAAYEEASISGLCSEGAWEVALGRLRSLDPEELLRRAQDGHDGEGTAL